MESLQNSTTTIPRVRKNAYLCGMNDKKDINWPDEEYPLTPYTMEEINAMIDEAERDFESGRFYTTEEVIHEVEEEIRKLSIQSA